MDGIARELVRLGCQVTLERSAMDAVREVRRSPYDLVLWTIGRQTARGLEPVSSLLEAAPALDVVVLARQAAFGSAVEAIVALGGPFTLEEIKEEHVRRILLSTDSLDEAAWVIRLRPRTLRRRLGRPPGSSPPPAALGS